MHLTTKGLQIRAANGIFDSDTDKASIYSCPCEIEYAHVKARTVAVDLAGNLPRAWLEGLDFGLAHLEAVRTKGVAQ